MSTSFEETSWKCPIDCPNCFRGRVYATQVSRMRCIAPTAGARMQPRSQVIESVKRFLPAPSLPRRFSTGTSMSSKKSSAIGDVRMPILSICFPIVRPGVPFSTRKAETPRAPLAGSTVAKTSKRSATFPFEMKVLLPLIT